MNLKDLIPGELYVLQLYHDSETQIGVFRKISGAGSCGVFYPATDDTSGGTGPWNRQPHQVVRPFRQESSASLTQDKVKERIACKCDLYQLWNGYGHNPGCS